MTTRPAFRAGSFYPSSGAACTTLIDGLCGGPSEPVVGIVVGGLVPHAGWVYSGHTACRTLLALGDPAPDTIVLFGAVHKAGVRRAAVSPADAWETPLGVVPVDREAVRLMREACGGLLTESPDPHAGEHSIEVQVPLVKRLLPDAAIVPVAVPPGPDAETLGTRVGEALRESPGRVVAIGSTDLTHYGPSFYGFAPKGTGSQAHEWSKEVNDLSFLAPALALDARGALNAAEAHRSACGAGAAAAAIGAARALGATSALLLEHVTSHEVRPDPAGPTNFVGYASVVFLAD